MRIWHIFRNSRLFNSESIGTFLKKIKYFSSKLYPKKAQKVCGGWHEIWHDVPILSQQAKNVHLAAQTQKMRKNNVWDAKEIGRIANVYNALKYFWSVTAAKDV